MNYTDLLRASSGDIHIVFGRVRAAAFAYESGPVSPENLRALHPIFAALLRVPRRVLKRWAARAAAGFPAGDMLKGPRLAEQRRSTLFPTWKSARRAARERASR